MFPSHTQPGWPQDRWDRGDGNRWLWNPGTHTAGRLPLATSPGSGKRTERDDTSQMSPFPWFWVDGWTLINFIAVVKIHPCPSTNKQPCTESFVYRVHPSQSHGVYTVMGRSTPSFCEVQRILSVFCLLFIVLLPDYSSIICGYFYSCYYGQ